MRITTSTRPVAALLTLAFLGTAFTTTTAQLSAYAAPITTTTLTQPVTVTSDTLQQTLMPVATPITTAPTPVTNTTTTLDPTGTPTLDNDSQASTSSDNSTASTPATTTTTPTAKSALTSTMKFVPTQSQAVGSDAGSLYHSRQISPAMATMLYKIAVITAMVGFVLYVATVLPTTPRGPRQLLKSLHKSQLKVKPNHS